MLPVLRPALIVPLRAPAACFPVAIATCRATIEALAGRANNGGRFQWRRIVSKRLVLVDFENVQKLDLSILDDSYRAIVFVGASQAPPKAARNKATAHRFSRVDFQKIEGTGKNALDFHIAFHLGRTFETAPETECIVLSKDKGYDPLLVHLNKNGLTCRRVVSLEQLLPEVPVASAEPDAGQVVCRRCGKSSTIEHHGGQWCTNCGSFASPPDPKLLPSQQLGFRENRRGPFVGLMERDEERSRLPECGWCHQRVDMGDGIYDDGEWMCGGCISRYAHE